MNIAVETRSSGDILYQAILAIIANGKTSTGFAEGYVRRDYILDVLQENNHPEPRDEASALIDKMNDEGVLCAHPLNDLRESHEQSWRSI